MRSMRDVGHTYLIAYPPQLAPAATDLSGSTYRVEVSMSVDPKNRQELADLGDVLQDVPIALLQVFEWCTSPMLGNRIREVW